ncbi:RNA-directed DNA polymerase [Massilia sp.]|uniref:RNA-directed DNA polymerase n=1 Tax=Massilia sp. TaxID=1882437 RepID=UPI00391D5ACE
MKTNSISSWQDIKIGDLFYAYRKAKVDCFKFTDVKCVAKSFAAFEGNLPANLSEILGKVRQGEIDQLLLDNLGKCRLVAKKLSVEPKKKGVEVGPHGYFSDPNRAFSNLRSRNNLIPEFRLVGDFPIVMHVLSALWINTVGHKYDAILSGSAYGSRLRRYRHTDQVAKVGSGDYHIEAMGSFQPYFNPYKRWRENGLRAIRRELEADGSVIAVSMDLTSYYHNIDPSFLNKDEFLKLNDIQLNDWELSFTSSFVLALKAWAKKASTWLEQEGAPKSSVKGGVPIGLAMARVAANALLASLDKSIESNLAPIYYGRYVDDIFLVLRDPGNVHDAPELLSYIAKRSSCFPEKIESSQSSSIELTLPGGIQGKTRLILKQDKQKIFFLKGNGGLDLLDNIENQIRSVSSERRLMPSPKRLASMASAKILTAAGHPADEADTLRKADGLVVRRLGWAIQLRAVEILARDLRKGDWEPEREKFYEFAKAHILRPDKILDHMDYLPRLLSIAVSLGDWANAKRMLTTTFSSLKTLSGADISALVLNGVPLKGNHSKVWETLRQTVIELAADAISRSLRWSQRDGCMSPINDIGKELCESVGLTSDYDGLSAISLLLRECDWAKTSYKDHLRRDAQRERQQSSNEESLHSLYIHSEDLKAFLDKSRSTGEGSGATRVNYRCAKTNSEALPPSLIPYLAPTRPYSTQEISLFLPSECIFENADTNPARAWARYVRAIRGVWVKPTLVSKEISAKKIKNEEKSFKRAYIGTTKRESPRLGISSLKTVQGSYSAAALGRQDVSRERYERIERLINQALKAYPKPTHLLLPELSLPDRWVETVSSLLRDAGISLIAGLDYHHTYPDFIHSEAVLILTDDRLGFPASVQIRQQKSLPAAGEEYDLLKTFGKQWPPKLREAEKPIYIHNGFHFGLLICSELQNVNHRLNFQGRVDCMMVLSWNRDLETFSALVESSSLDVHAHIALVNNRIYGDSRVRAPAKANHGRDLCRIRGGENEHVVVVEIDIDQLRAFQSRATRWPGEKDPYKPVPEGFQILSSRKAIPR